jgi:hypothetical protein
MKKDFSDSNPTAESRFPGIHLSSDGYVRLTLATLHRIPLVHLMSAMDDECPGDAGCGAQFAPISGYTEWVSTTVPALSIGWDWELCASRSQLCYARIGGPRSNIMLIDQIKGRDLGSDRTSTLLASFIDSLPWQQHVEIHITNRYT